MSSFYLGIKKSILDRNLPLYYLVFYKLLNNIEVNQMNQKQLDTALRGIAGTLILVSSIMYFVHSSYWIYFII